MQLENNHPIQLFRQVLSSEAALTDVQADQLQTLIYSFPQCGVLHAIQAAHNADSGQLTQAAAWFGTSELLEKVVKAPQVMPVVTAAGIIFRSRPQPKQVHQDEAAPEEAEVVVTPEADIPATSAVAIEEDVKSKHEPEADVEPHAEPKFAPPIYKQEPFDETQKLIVENLAANDYFVFDKAFADRNQMEPPTVIPEVIAAPAKPTVTLAPAEEGSVTRYHDDKMPYSFLWWLDKTRHKHSQVYQPFANPAVNTGTTPAIHENHVKDVLEDRTKEEEIVERFIQEEPQMRPPSGDKLDNENKAKHSVEDQEELITETLARIYADQMLYSKAIAAYKILILKNPEKRRYFASQIEVLEKKIN